MPSKHTVRDFHNLGYYHVFNRGVAKQDVFRDSQDYKVFLYFVKNFLLEEGEINKDDMFYQPRRQNYYNKMQLHAYCLMPNHYHLFVSQLEDNGVSKFMQSLGNAYSRYFNEKYNRVGPVFQGKFKAATIANDSHYLHLSRYIHQNPLALNIEPTDYEFSSCKFYVDKATSPKWLASDEILSNFRNPEDYIKFMKENTVDSKVILGEEAID